MRPRTLGLCALLVAAPASARAPTMNQPRLLTPLSFKLAYAGLQPIWLTPGAATPSHPSVRFVGVTAEERLPRGLEASHSGKAVVAAEIDDERVELSIPGKAYFGPYTFESPWPFVPHDARAESCRQKGRYVVCLAALEPYPVAQQPPPRPDAYRAAFFVDTVEARVARERTLALAEDALGRAHEALNLLYVYRVTIVEPLRRLRVTYAEGKTRTPRLDVDVDLTAGRARLTRLP